MKCTYYPSCNNEATVKVTVIRGGGDKSPQRDMCHNCLNRLQIYAVKSDLPVTFEVTRPAEFRPSVT
jgi:hypothetical protein